MKQISKTICRTPTPGKTSIHIDSQKFELIKAAILKVLPKDGEGILFKDLATNVGREISEEKLQQLGTLSWYTTTIKLELEVAGDIFRVTNSSPQRLLRK